MTKPVGSGVDRLTGLPLSGWPHVVQCLGVIFTTTFGSRVMRRWFGSLIPNLLGENLSPLTLLRYKTALFAALAFEPRFAITRINIRSGSDELRSGRLRVELEGQYRPRAHLGDFTVEGARKAILGATDDRTTTEGA